MPVKAKPTKPAFNWRLPFGLVVIGGIAWYFTGGQDASPAKKATAKSGASASGTAADKYTKEDYSASFPILKIDAKNSFKPLVQKTLLVADLSKGGLPNTITGGGDWSYDGVVAVDGKVQGLMDEQKSGESDYIEVGQHWKHGKVKRITDSEIQFAGDDGSSATLKMGDSSANASKTAVATPSPNAPVAVQPDSLPGSLDITALPDPSQQNQGVGGRRRGGGGGGGRRNRNFNLGQ